MTRLKLFYTLVLYQIFLMASLIPLVKSKNQIHLYFSTFTGISPAVALSDGKLFTTFLTVASKTH